ncbi:MAG: MBL fold metallo-hydrolase [Phycisphaerae bacterium]|nr:MBL fold metallo-hydrolase [Phycisphaerae bacterium]
MTWSIKILRAGTMRLDGGGMFGVVPKTMWERLSKPDEHNRILLQTNCLLLEQGGTKVLVETGCGSKWSKKEREIYAIEDRTVVDALHEENIDPSEISHVVVSHLHFDHAGGLTTLNKDCPVPTFPNAAVHVQAQEWADANQNRAVMTRTYLPTHLEPIVSQVKTHTEASTILEGLTVASAPGHTWGQQAIHITAPNGQVVFPADVVPTIHHAPPAFVMAYDIEPYTAMQTKINVLTQAAEQGWTIALGHEPGPVLVKAESDPERPERRRLVPCQ